MKKIFIILFGIALLTSCNSKTSNTKEQLAVQPDTIQKVLHVERMSCHDCELTIEGSVKELAGIVSVKANHEDSTTVVKYDASKVSLASISKAIEKKGYLVTGEVD